MKANVENIRYSDRVVSHRKDNAFESQISIVDRDNGREIVICRIYRPFSVAYCCLWIRSKGSGAGKAGGYGYHKASAALDAAIRDAGIVLSEHIDGHGDSAMLDALEAIARAVTGKRKFFVVKAHS